MKIASWNVNSIKARLPIALDWLKHNEPDVLLMQEIKCENGAFPSLEFQSLGYKIHINGQKTYNGVAILTKADSILNLDRLPGDDNDPQARYLEINSNGLVCINIYAPNGNPVDSEKFPYKLSWLERLITRVEGLLKDEKPFLIGGDYNICPTAEDLYDPKGWENEALYHPRSRALWRRLTTLGLTDAFRALHPQKKHAYTFWDYQAGAWQRDQGLRIDHFLLSPETTDRLRSCVIDRAPRGLDKASDHTPIVIEIA